MERISLKLPTREELAEMLLDKDRLSECFIGLIILSLLAGPAVSIWKKNLIYLVTMSFSIGFYVCFCLSREYFITKKKREDSPAIIDVVPQATPAKELNDEKEKEDRTLPPIAVLAVYPLNPSKSPRIRYKNKVRIVLKNMSKETLHLSSAAFEENMVPVDVPRPMVFQHELSPGSWNVDRWAEPTTFEIEVKSNEIISTWIGLECYFDKTKIERLHEVKGLGTIIPVVDGQKERVRISV